MYPFAGVAMTKYPKMGELNQQEFVLSQLRGARSPEPRCRQVGSFRGYEGRCVAGLSPAPGAARFADASPRSLLRLRMVFFPHARLCPHFPSSQGHWPC